MRTPFLVAAAAFLASACGGGKLPLAPTPTSATVTFVVFLDENRNGALDPPESIRVPGVEVTFGAISGRSAPLTGSFSVEVLQTPQMLSVSTASLPPYYRGPEPVVQAPPASGSFNVPVTLPLGGSASPGVFLAFGDSITNGQTGVGDGQGYTGELERRLAAHFGRARVINDGLDSSNSERGDDRIDSALAHGRPAFTLILYGTNDWADPRCAEPPCFTVDRLRSMVRKVKGQGGYAFLGTLLMTSVGNDFRASPRRNSWVAAQNDNIRRMAAEEEVVLADHHAAFERSPLQYSDLFADYIHPSAEGYRLLAQTWFDAVTNRR